METVSRMVQGIWHVPHSILLLSEWTDYLSVTDVLYLNLAGTDVIVLDSSKAATDLLESRSSLYSGR